LNASDLNIAAVLPGAESGPAINGVETDIVTILTADNNFTDVGVTAVSSTSVTVDPAVVDIDSGVDRVIEGQLMMIRKGTTHTLVQVTGLNGDTGVITFAADDSLHLNQTGTDKPGNLQALVNTSPTGAAGVAATLVTRVRMITYYLDDTTTPGRPRLVRRINNGDPFEFDNTLGTAVVIDAENLRFTYDLNDGAANPSGVRFVAEDLTDSGACAPDPCALNQIRKINVTLTVRSLPAGENARAYRNTLTSQVALRGMALVNRYQ
jgi:hypothetical protein